VPPGGSVLDVGTGPGHLLVEIGRRRPDVRIVGVDPSADMVGHAEHRTAEASLHERVEVRVGAAESLPFGEESFDAVVSTLSAHHWADVAAAVREQARVVRAGGSIWVFDLRRAPVREVAQRLGAEAALVVRPARLGRVASVVLVGYRADRG
jgi:ubiquinone/menaquinone biosynthesis C-methylase UbiE